MSEPESAEEQLAPYVIEGARSSRSRCKTCRRAIEKETLRIGILIEGPYGTGYMWHHLHCAARRQLERVEEAYAAEAWKEAKHPPSAVPDLAELRKLKEQAEERKQARRDPPYVERAPTGRSKCKHCEEPIEQGALRVVLAREVTFGRQVRTTPINVHARCAGAELLAEDCATEIEGFAEALRAGSQVEPADVAAALDEIGSLPD